MSPTASSEHSPDAAGSPDGPHGPFHGVRILDMTSVVMGPYATQILGDLGADVICVEDAKGDTNRAMGPGPEKQFSGVSMNLLRNKRNICLDLKHPQGRETLLRIAATCDVLVTNLRPGPLQRLRLTYADVRPVRDDIIFCQAQGFPSDSARAADPAYDDIMQAATGIADSFARQTGVPNMVPTLVADKVSGLTIAYGIMAALYHRAMTGQGQHLEIPMSDAVTAFTLVEHGSSAIGEPKQGPAGYPRILTPNRRPQRTLDGWIAVLPYSGANYASLFKEGGREELLEDERLKSERSRIVNAHILYEFTAEVLATRTTAHWLEFCEREGIPSSAVRTLDELVDDQPLAVHPTAGPYRVITSPVRFSATPASVRRHAPHIGEHDREVLAEVGLTPDEIDALVQSGAVPR